MKHPAVARRWPRDVFVVGGLGLAEDGFVGFDFGGAVDEVVVFGHEGEGVGLVEVDVEGFFGGVAGEKEEKVVVGVGAVEAVVEVAGFGAGDGDAVTEGTFKLGGLARLGAKADGDDVLFGRDHGRFLLWCGLPSLHRVF
jgi:hypothetical protein